MMSHPSRSLLASMFMAFAGFSLWAWSDATIHYLHHYPTILIAFITDTLSMVFLFAMAPWLGGIRDTFTKPCLKLRLFRGALLGVSNILSFIVFTHLDLAKAYALIFMTPLLAKILSALILKDKISWQCWAISILGFAGVLIVLRPGWVSIDIGSMAALSLTIFFALGYVLSRYIGEENQTHLSAAAFQYVFVALALAYPAIQIWHETQFNLFDIALMIFAALISGLGSVLVAYAFLAPAAYIAPIHYTQILWGAGLGALLFAEYPDIWTLVGGAVIIGSGLLLIQHSRSLPEKI